MTEETKQLDAHDALLLMAEAFAVADGDGNAMLCGDVVYCQCSAAKSLRRHGVITVDVFDQIRAMKCLGCSYSKEDAARSAARCREQAAKLRPVEKPKTVADALREMPVGQRFRRPKYKSDRWFQKKADDLFSSNAGEFYRTHDFYELDTPHDDPAYGIIILPAAEPVEQPAGVVVSRDQAANIERLAKALIDMNITLCKYVADDGNLTPMQSEAIRKAYIAEQVNASMVFHDITDARRKAGE